MTKARFRLVDTSVRKNKGQAFYRVGLARPFRLVHRWHVPESSKGVGSAMLFLYLENLQIRSAEFD